MSSKVSPTLKVLHEIRDEARKTNERLTRVDDRVEGLEQAMAQQLTGVAAAVREVRDLLVDRLDVRDLVVDHERRIRALERKTG